MNLYISFRSKTDGPYGRVSMWGHRTDHWSKVLAYRVKTSGNVVAPSTIQITKEVGSNSVELFRAYNNADKFDEVVIEAIGRSPSNPGAGEMVVERITLTNAVINSVWRSVSVLPTSTGKLVEDFGLLFEGYDRQTVS
jgi:hypothetical protein